MTASPEALHPHSIPTRQCGRHSIDLKYQAKGGQQAPPLAVQMMGGTVATAQHEFLDCPFRGSQEGASAWEIEWTINFAFSDSDSRASA